MGISRTITLTQYAKQLRHAAERGVREAIEAGLQRAAPRCVALLQAKANAPGVPFDTGEYRRRFAATVTGLQLSIYNTDPKAPIIEDGRRAGARMPPVNALIPWVKRKGLGRKGRLKKLGDQALRGVAWAVARSIAKRGLRAHHVFRGAGAEIDRIVRAEVAGAVNRALVGER